MRRWSIYLVLAAVSAFARAHAQEGRLQQAGIRLQQVAMGLSSPLFLTAPANDARLFIVEQPGRIKIVRDGQLLSRPFLDIRDRVSSGGERGLLGLAFHPSYGANGFFYVNYTDRRGDTHIERFSVTADADVADPASGKLVLMVTQPAANHNGGCIVFGPDRMLYVGMGDGGGAGDPQGNGQNRNQLLGKMLRIDVDGGDPYAIPSDNPFAGQNGTLNEIWALGLRNPWRFAFDRVANMLYIADVGQGRREEIDVVPVGKGGFNFGWNLMEGNDCYRTSNCDQTGLTLPVLQYGHGEGCSVTGGYVYRGTRIPDIVGHYFYADYCDGWIRSFKYVNGTVTDPRQWDVGNVGRIQSFGEAASGELYVLSDTGTVYRIEPA